MPPYGGFNPARRDIKGTGDCPSLSLCFVLSVEKVLGGLGIEEVHYLAAEGNVELLAGYEALSILGIEGDGRHSDDKAGAILGVNVEMELGAHHLVDLEGAGDAVLIRGEGDMLGTDAEGDVLANYALLREIGADRLRREEAPPVDGGRRIREVPRALDVDAPQTAEDRRPQA